MQQLHLKIILLALAGSAISQSPILFYSFFSQIFLPLQFIRS